MAIEIRSPADEEELKAAMTAAEIAFGSGAVEDEDWERGRRALPASRAHAAFDGGKPVALAGAYRFDLSIPGGELPCAGVTWVGVMPTHRRRGIRRAARCAWSTPTRRSHSSGPCTSGSGPPGRGSRPGTSAGGRSIGSPTRRAG